MMTDTTPTREMPKYKCHKEVHALQIKEIRLGHATGRHLIVPAEEGFGLVEVDSDWLHKHGPQIGGYYIVYDDGYKSFSPAGVFEAGYTLIE